MYKQIGNSIRKLRNKFEIKSVELAKLSSVGSSYLSQIENNRVKPTKKTLNKIIDCFERLSVNKKIDCQKEIADLKELLSKVENNSLSNAEINESRQDYPFTKYDKHNDLDSHKNFTNFISENIETIFRLFLLFDSPFKKEVEHSLKFFLSYTEEKLLK